MASFAQPGQMTVDEFLRWEPEDRMRYELEDGVLTLAGEPLIIDGRTVAMSAGRHGTPRFRVISLLRSLRGFAGVAA